MNENRRGIKRGDIVVVTQTVLSHGNNLVRNALINKRVRARGVDPAPI